MNNTTIIGIVALVIILALSVYFIFIHKSGSSNNTEADRISNVFNDFFSRMDEKYEIKSSKVGLQIMESIVGNSLKVAEEVLELPDVKWSLENLLFDGVDVNKINNAISPVFDCMAQKVRTIGQDPELIQEWESMLDQDLTSESASITSVFANKLGENARNDIKSCIEQNVTSDEISTIRTEFNIVANNVSSKTPMTLQKMPENITTDDILSMM